MIILADAENGTKSDNDQCYGPTLRQPQPTHSRSSTGSVLSDPPDYEENTPNEQKARLGFLATKLHIPWIDRRIWRATLIALGVYIFLTLTVAVPVIVLKSRSAISYYIESNYSPGPFDDLSLNSYSGLQLSATMLTIQNLDSSCNVWDHIFPETRTALGSMSMTPLGDIGVRINATYTPSERRAIDGQLNVLANTNVSESNAIFMIDMAYSPAGLRNRTSVCFSRSGASKGLNIYPPYDMAKDDKLMFNITVLLPLTTNLSSFQTYLPLISQHFGNLSGTPLTVGNYSIQGGGRPITCQALEAFTINVVNVVGAIKGSFQTSMGLVLSTIKADIVSNVTLISNRGSVPSGANLQTGDGSIDAAFSLKAFAAPPDVNPGDFRFHDITARTFNRPLNISVRYLDREDPYMRDPLTLMVQNSLGPATISLDSGYKGYFMADTKLDEVTVNYPASMQRVSNSYLWTQPDLSSGSSSSGTSPDSPTTAPPRWIDYGVLEDNTHAVGSLGSSSKVSTGPARFNGNINVKGTLGPITLSFDTDNL